MIRLIEIVILLLLLRMLWRAFRKWLEEVEDRRPDSDTGNVVYGGHMVRDPVCGVFIPENRSIAVRQGGEVHHFCSETCREAFRKAEARVS